MRWGAFFRDYKLISVILLIVVAVGLIFFMPTEKETFEIKDRCGKFMNLVQHTIDDPGVCQTQCKNKCRSVEQKFDSFLYDDTGPGCNTCECICKK